MGFLWPRLVSGVKRWCPSPLRFKQGFDGGGWAKESEKDGAGANIETRISEQGGRGMRMKREESKEGREASAERWNS